MSVTFAVQFLPDAAPIHGFYCYESDTAVGPFDSPARLALAVSAHERECEGCRMYGVASFPLPEEEFDVNLSNTNAGMILGILGLPLDSDDFELVGRMGADDFLGYVLLALAVERDNAEVNDVVEANPGRATIVQCGLPEGYVGTVLGRLADLAVEAKRLGRYVTWA